MDRGPWWATVPGVAMRWAWLTEHTHIAHIEREMCGVCLVDYCD